MKYSAPVIFILLCVVCSSLLSGSFAVAQRRTNKVYTVAEEQPEFPGGGAALSAYLAENIRIPGVLVRKNYISDPVAARFIIDELGYVKDVRILTKTMDKKTLRYMKGYMAAIITAIEKMPRWQPGKVGGKSVTVFYTLPIEVSLQ